MTTKTTCPMNLNKQILALTDNSHCCEHSMYQHTCLYLCLWLKLNTDCHMRWAPNTNVCHDASHDELQGMTWRHELVHDHMTWHCTWHVIHRHEVGHDIVWLNRYDWARILQSKTRQTQNILRSPSDLQVCAAGAHTRLHLLRCGQLKTLRQQTKSSGSITVLQWAPAITIALRPPAFLHHCDCHCMHGPLYNANGKQLSFTS